MAVSIVGTASNQAGCVSGPIRVTPKEHNEVAQRAGIERDVAKTVLDVGVKIRISKSAAVENKES
jgi:hypothetical protein